MCVYIKRGKYIFPLKNKEEKMEIFNKIYCFFLQNNINTYISICGCIKVSFHISHFMVQGKSKINTRHGIHIHCIYICTCNGKPFVFKSPRNK